MGFDPPTSASYDRSSRLPSFVRPAEAKYMTRIAKYSDWLWILASGVLVIVRLLTLNVSQPAMIQTTAGTTTVDISSDQSWIWPFSDCTTITWQIEGITALYVDDEGRIGSDSMVFCPQVNLTSVEFEVIDQNNISRTYILKIHYWLDELLYVLSFAGIGFAGIAVAYFLIVPDMTRKPPIGFSLFLLVSLSVGISIIRNNSSPAPVIDTQQGNTFIYFSAETNQALFPEECIDVRWQVVNADSVMINGVEQPLRGEAEHCQEDGDVAQLGINGSGETYDIPLNFLFPHL